MQAARYSHSPATRTVGELVDLCNERRRERLHVALLVTGIDRPLRCFSGQVANCVDVAGRTATLGASSWLPACTRRSGSSRTHPECVVPCDAHGLFGLRWRCDRRGSGGARTGSAADRFRSCHGQGRGNTLASSSGFMPSSSPRWPGGNLLLALLAWRSGRCVRGYNGLAEARPSLLASQPGRPVTRVERGKSTSHPAVQAGSGASPLHNPQGFVTG